MGELARKPVRCKYRKNNAVYLNMGKDYAWQLLHQAVHALIGEGTQRERLEYAAKAIHRLQPNDIPDELQGAYTAIMERVRQDDDHGSNIGRIAATVANMTDSEVNEYANKILSLYDAITRYMKP
jgi:hypothetical protein